MSDDERTESTTITNDPTDERTATDPETYRIPTDCTHEEFIAAAKVYARTVVETYDLAVRVSELDWEVSTRAKRRAGAVKSRDGEPTTISVTWKYFQTNGWEQVAAIVRHELIHVHLINRHDDHTHGDRFRAWAEKLETDVRCDRFSEPKWWVSCTECATEIPRYRRSKLVTDTEKYRCGDCGGQLQVVENNS